MLDAGAPVQMESVHSFKDSEQSVGGALQQAAKAGQPQPAEASGHAVSAVVDAVEEFRPGHDMTAVSVKSEHTNEPMGGPATQVQQFNMSAMSDDSDTVRLPDAGRSRAGSEQTPKATEVQAMSPVSDSDVATPIRGFGDSREQAPPHNARPGGQQQPVQHTAVQHLSVDSASDDDDAGGPTGGWTGIGVRVTNPAPAAAAPPATTVRGFNEDTSPLDNSGVQPFSPASASSAASRARDLAGPRDRSISQLMEESL